MPTPNNRILGLYVVVVLLVLAQISILHSMSRRLSSSTNDNIDNNNNLESILSIQKDEPFDADSLELCNSTNGQVEQFEFVQENNLTAHGYDVRPLLNLSLTYQHPTSDIRAGICVKTLHGEGRRNLMNFVLTFAAYNRLLGFDEILIWYSKDFRPVGFELLESLPYVTLIENTRNPMVKPGDYEIRRDMGNGGQEGDIRECLELTKGKFDWIMIADWDEFLWFKDKIRLKEFLGQNANTSYISFGKWTYSYKDTIDADENLFGFENRPFTLKTYCAKNNGKAYCPDWLGRSKVMFRPGFPYYKINIHGGFSIDPSRGRIHMDPSVAHLKEWRSAFGPGNDTLHERKSFKVPANDLQNNEYKLNKDGKTYTMHYDKNLQRWFDFLAGKKRRMDSLESVA